MEINNNLRHFQWIAGENKGQIKILDNIVFEEGEVFLVFKDGSRINENFVAEINKTDLSNKFMAEVSDMDNVWKFEENWIGRMEERWEKNADGVNVCVQPYYPGKYVLKLIPPEPTKKTKSIFSDETSNSHTTNVTKEIKNIETVEDKENINIKEEEIKTQSPRNVNIENLNHLTDPIYILVSKSKKENIEINIALNISLPPKNLYDIIKSTFEEGDDKFIQYIANELSTSEIIESIKLSLKDMYENIENIEK